jgi:hypothetical protein
MAKKGQKKIREAVIDLTILLFGLDLLKHHVFLTFPSLKNQIFEILLFELFEKKGRTIIHEKCHFLLNMYVLSKVITNLISNFT